MNKKYSTNSSEKYKFTTKSKKNKTKLQSPGFSPTNTKE